MKKFPKDKYDFSIEGREFTSTGKRLLDSCIQSTKYLSDMIVEYGVGEPETLRAAELNKSCIESVDELRNTCHRLLISDTVYPNVCDDPRLN